MPSAKTNKKLDNLIKISAMDFVEGMYIGTDLYVMIGENLVMLCSNSTLSKDLIAKINDFSLTGDSLYIDKAYYATMGKHRRVHEKKSSAEVDVFEKYESIKNAAADAFRSMGNDEQIPWNQTTKLVLQINEQINYVKAPFILQCISAIRSTDQYLYSHSVNVSMLNGLMAKWLGKNEKETETLINIGLLHDIGKLRIPSAILDKPSRLTAEEFETMKRHPVYSQEILAKSGVTDEKLLAGVRGHHEQANGCGYPDHLTLEMIPEYSRVTAISDIYDAMVAQRVYKNPASPFAVLEQFSKDRFSQLDIHLVNLFLTQLSVELVGKKVKLSNGIIGEVLYVDKEKFGYPIVRVNGTAIPTTPELCCTALIAD